MFLIITNSSHIENLVNTRTIRRIVEYTRKNDDGIRSVILLDNGSEIYAINDLEDIKRQLKQN